MMIGLFAPRRHLPWLVIAALVMLGIGLSVALA